MVVSVAGWLLVVLGTGIAVRSVLQRGRLRAVAEHGVAADAEVVGTTARRLGARVGSAQRAVVTFALPDGSRHRATTRVPSPVPSPAGRTVPVRYDPRHPGRVVLAGDLQAAAAGAVGGVLAGVGAATAGWTLLLLVAVVGG